MSEQGKVEEWFERRCFTLDLAGLTEEERKEGSILLGGSAAEFILPSDSFRYNQVRLVVFKWGDKTIDNVIANLLEHEDTPGREYIPFNLSAVIGDMLWSLTIQDRSFDPSTAYRNESYYTVIPFDEAEGQKALQDHQTLPIPRPELLAKVGFRWFAFEMGTNIRQDAMYQPDE
jgi:hypothetical protein